jgi:hypothetical protein
MTLCDKCGFPLQEDGLCSSKGCRIRSSRRCLGTYRAKGHVVNCEVCGDTFVKGAHNARTCTKEECKTVIRKRNESRPPEQRQKRTHIERSKRRKDRRETV